MLRCCVIVVATFALAGCTKRSELYCQNNPDKCDPVDGPASHACAGDPDCAGVAGSPACDLATMTCVACNTNRECATSADGPVCAADHACHLCTSHAQCDSKACLPDGSCAPAAMVAYVAASPTGSGTTCSLAAPCATLDNAVKTTLPFVKIASGGTVSDTISTVVDRSVTILADPSAVLDRSGDGPLLQVTNGADVKIYDLEITGATTTGPMAGHGIVIDGAATKLHLTRTSVHNNAALGILANAGTLDMTRSKVWENAGGGIQTAAGGIVFTLTNNFIYRNGNPGNATVGGASLNPAAGSVFAFNTVVDNLTKNVSTSAGVNCDDNLFVAPNNIIARNFINNDATKPTSNVFGLCNFSSGFTGASITALMFASPDVDSPYDYHLRAGSSAIDQGLGASDVVTDFDGDSRPIGAAKDQGADEFKP